MVFIEQDEKGGSDFSLVVSQEKNGLRGIRAITEGSEVTDYEIGCNERPIPIK